VWDPPPSNNSFGVQDVKLYDKPVLFYRPAINDTGIARGGHRASPIGQGKWLSDTHIPPPLLFHAKYFHAGALTARYELYKKRLAEETVRHRWGLKYTRSAAQVEAEMASVRNISEALPWHLF
jgi:hypothetical protein